METAVRQLPLRAVSEPAPGGHAPVRELHEAALARARSTPLAVGCNKLRPDVPGQMAQREAVLGRDAQGERHLQEQPGVPLAPEEHFAARGTPGEVEEEDGDDDDDGEDDEPHSHTTTRTSLEKMMVMMMMMKKKKNKMNTVSFPWRVVLSFRSRGLSAWRGLPAWRAR